uniref:Uncharacterized protein n=1 Tax=Glossina austeni TaxID=7395 RepID=A0A1A9VYD1_GLOAU
MLLACSVSKARGLPIPANDLSIFQIRTRLSSPPKNETRVHQRVFLADASMQSWDLTVCDYIRVIRDACKLKDFKQSVPEETLRTQRVDIYLQDLKERLKQLRQKHDEVIQNSVEIIREIEEVSSSLLVAPQENVSNAEENMTKIKKLIQEFESAKRQGTSSKTKLPVVLESRVDIQQILQNFEHLTESRVLKESLLLFRKAKESFEKIDNFFGKLGCLDGSVNAVNAATAAISRYNVREAQLNKTASNNVRSKIELFNQSQSLLKTCKSCATEIDFNILLNDSHHDKPDRKHVDGVCSTYASCCSSLLSLPKCLSKDSIVKRQKSLDTGYEGDNDDSDYNLLISKKKKLGNNSTEINRTSD